MARELGVAETTPATDATVSACPTCQSLFRPSGRRRFCSDACRRLAWDRRQQLAPAPGRVTPGGPPLSIYGCAACGSRAAGEQRCERCRTAMARIGLGGICPHCDELVAVADLLIEEVMPKAIT